MRRPDLSFLSAYSLTLNYVLGCGILSIPAAFGSAGIILSSFFILSVSIIAVISAVWQVESSGRASELSRKVNPHILANALTPVANRVADDDRVQLLHTVHDSEYMATSDDDLEESVPRPRVSFPGTPVASSPVSATPADRVPFSINQLFEGNELMAKFYGPIGQRIYELCVIAYMGCAMWSYGTIFASSMALSVPIPWFTSVNECHVTEACPWRCDVAYIAFLVVFAVIVVPMSCSEMKEQVVVQVALTLFRFVAIGTMVVTILIAIFRQPFGPESRQTIPYTLKDIKLADYRGIGHIFSVSLFAQLMHHSTTPLVSILTNKRRARLMFMLALGTTCFLYIFLGIVASLYFGQSIADVASLQWMSYTAESGHRVIHAVIISYLVIMFPPLDLLSAFPLNGVTLGNNLRTAIPFKLTRPGTFLFEHPKALKVGMRLVAVIPPLLLASIFRKPTVVIELGGMFGFMLIFFAPALIQIKSRIRCKKLIREQPHLAGDHPRRALNTPYGWIFSHSAFAWTVLIVGTLCLLFSIFLFITGQG